MTPIGDPTEEGSGGGFRVGVTKSSASARYCVLGGGVALDGDVGLDLERGLVTALGGDVDFLALDRVTLGFR